MIREKVKKNKCSDEVDVGLIFDYIFIPGAKWA